MGYGLFPVFCRTQAARCINDDVLIGYKPQNTKARCPICGRWSVAEKSKTNNKRVEQCKQYLTL